MAGPPRWHLSASPQERTRCPPPHPTAPLPNAAAASAPLAVPAPGTGEHPAFAGKAAAPAPGITPAYLSEAGLPQALLYTAFKKRRPLPAESRLSGSGLRPRPLGPGCSWRPRAPPRALGAALSSAPSLLRGAGPGGDTHRFGHLLRAARWRRPRPGQGPGDWRGGKWRPGPAELS